VLRSRSLEEKVELHDLFEENVWPHLLSGEIKPVIYKTLPIEETSAAHALLANNETIGKVILKVRD
jgi:NADPH2:quinone reductase